MTIRRDIKPYFDAHSAAMARAPQDDRIVDQFILTPAAADLLETIMDDIRASIKRMNMLAPDDDRAANLLGVGAVLRGVEPMKRADLIAKEYRDEDGYWIELRPGFVVRGDAHGIVENTRREARAKLADVVPCDCADCRRLRGVA